jgi:hypothetical protein
VKIYLKRTFSGLIPDDEQSAEYVQKIKLGNVVSCEVKRPRNHAFHRKFFAMLSLTHNNQDQFPDTKLGREQMLSWVKIHTGLVDYWKDPLKGDWRASPRSISFSSMDDLAFAEFYDAAKDLIFEHLIPMATPSDVVNFEREMLAF